MYIMYSWQKGQMPVTLPPKTKTKTDYQCMKQALFMIGSYLLLLSSCCTIFSGTKQTITFQAPNGTKIYDATTNVKVAEVKDGQTATIQIRKRREDRILVAHHTGCMPTTFMLETSFNGHTLWNLFFWPGFLVDFITEKMYKWSTPIIPIELEPDEEFTDDCDIS